MNLVSAMERLNVVSTELIDKSANDHTNID